MHAAPRPIPAAALLLFAALPAAAQEASSANYVMQFSGTTMAGGPSESQSYKVSDSAGLPFGGGEMTSASFSAEFGVVIMSLDSDGDGVLGADDLCPTEYSGCYDPDFDGCIDTPDADADSDGVSAGSCDCNDGDPQIWGRPGEVRNLTLGPEPGGTGTLLSWDPPLDPGGPMPLYDTIRSADAADFLAAATCVETDDSTDTTAIETADPAAGTVLYYLVRAENGCAGGVGSTGTSQAIYARAARDCVAFLWWP
jgi:hypothetical protein